MGKIQGLAKGDRAIENHQKSAKAANKDGERHGAFFEGLRVKDLITEGKQCAQNREPKALPSQCGGWENNYQCECHKQKQHCVEQYAICPVLKKLSARAPLQGHFGAPEKRHCQYNKKL